MIRAAHGLLALALFLCACGPESTGLSASGEFPASVPNVRGRGEPRETSEPPTLEIAAGPFDAGAVIDGRVSPEGDYLVEWRDSAGTLARVRTVSAFSIRLEHPRFAANEVVVLSGEGAPKARRRFLMNVSRFTRHDYMRIVDLRGGFAESIRDFPAEGLLWRVGDPVPPPDDDRPVLVDLAMERILSADGGRRCLSEIDIAREAATGAREAIGLFGARRVFAISLGRDFPAGCGLTPLDAKCAEDFRTFVRRKYAEGPDDRKALDSVAVAWGRPLAKWDDVRPEPLSERSGRYTAWNDYMEFRDLALAGTIERAAGAVREIAPWAAIGYFGIEIPTAHGGADFRELARAVDWRGGRLRPGFDKLMSENLPPGRSLFSTGTPDAASALWAAFGRGALIQVFTPSESEAASACRPLVGGLGRALAESSSPRATGTDSPRAAKVAVVYSPRSVRASLAMDARAASLGDHTARMPGDASFARVFESWARLLEDIGAPWVPVYEDDVSSGALDPARFRVAILARTLSLSDGALDGLARFADAGGVVLADGGAGLFDEYLSTSGRRRIREIFGIEYKEARLSEVGGRSRPVTDKAFRFVLAPDDESWFSGMSVTGTGPALTGITLAGARAEAAFGETPCLIVNRLGGGWVVTLNLAVSAYFERGGSPLRRLVDESLRRAGVRPSVVLSHDNVYPPPAAAPRLLGDIDLVAVSGRTKAFRMLLPDRLGALRQLFPAAPVGWTNSVEIDLTASGFAAYALLPYRISAIDVEAVGQSGRAEAFAVEVRTETEGPLQRHMLDVDVERPDGLPAPELSRTVTTTGGRAEFTIPFALSDPPGLWTVRVRDTLTGARAISRFLRQ